MSSFAEKFRKLERLDALIRRRGTGSPTELAKRLKVSVRTLYNYVNDLRCLGAEIEFCLHRCTYYYVQPFRPFGRTEEEDRTPPPIFRRLSEFFKVLQESCIAGSYIYK